MTPFETSDRRLEQFLHAHFIRFGAQHKDDRVRRTVLKDDNGKWLVAEKTKTVKSKRKVEVAPFIIERLLALPREGEFVVNVFDHVGTKRS